jgi:hypothetical protein
MIEPNVKHKEIGEFAETITDKLADYYDDILKMHEVLKDGLIEDIGNNTGIAEAQAQDVMNYASALTNFIMLCNAVIRVGQIAEHNGEYKEAKQELVRISESVRRLNPDEETHDA